MKPLEINELTMQKAREYCSEFYNCVEDIQRKFNLSSSNDERLDITGAGVSTCLSYVNQATMIWLGQLDSENQVHRELKEFLGVEVLRMNRYMQNAFKQMHRIIELNLEKQ